MIATTAALDACAAADPSRAATNAGAKFATVLIDHFE